jgi:hypothetical protein
MELVEWLKVKTLSSKPSTTKKVNNRKKPLIDREHFRVGKHMDVLEGAVSREGKETPSHSRPRHPFLSSVHHSSKVFSLRAYGNLQRLTNWLAVQEAWDDGLST